MSKSPKNVVRDILKAQGLPWDTEPTQEAVRILSEYAFQEYCRGSDDQAYEAAMNGYYG